MGYSAGYFPGGAQMKGFIIGDELRWGQRRVEKQGLCSRFFEYFAGKLLCHIDFQSDVEKEKKGENVMICGFIKRGVGGMEKS